ncbi:MAG: hypothetical protein KatS3mg076_1651 [Candidatus Binatia bacterium]|nr:MAG: hypothetical protein KatS3mg076_1651 [Candidatus Binatia bacterium]
MKSRTKRGTCALVLVAVLSAAACKSRDKQEVRKASSSTATPTFDPTVVATLSPEDRKLLFTLVLVAEAHPEEGSVPLEVKFTVEADEELVRPRYRWDFGDGSPVSEEASPVHVYRTPGLYTVTVEIRDEATGKSGTDQLLVDAQEPEEESEPAGEPGESSLDSERT